MINDDQDNKLNPFKKTSSVKLHRIKVATMLSKIENHFSSHGINIKEELQAIFDIHNTHNNSQN